MTLTLETDRFGFIEFPGDVWVRPGTVTAYADADTFSTRVGAMGARVGIYLEPVPPPGTEVILEFDTLPLSIPSSAGITLDLSERLGTLPSRTGVSDPLQEHGLYISGTKRIGLSVGDGGGLDQGTRITVDGTAAPGVTVTGSVTDRNLSGASSSELVSQLDRIFFNVQGERWRVRLGDMEWERGDGETGPLSWRRELSGVDLYGDPSGWLTTGGGYGTSAEDRRRKSFLTQEGIQGPYDISGGWEIVPGSERVWLDGSPMERGASADYQMEYTAGLITFTPRRLIRADQRVEVTYFQRGDGFRKDLGTVSAEGGWESGGITFTGLLVEDDRESPLGFVLSPEAIEVLSMAGEDPADAWLDGAEHVGPGGGSYDRDSLERFVFRGPHQGEWKVVFGRPPDGPGDYIYDSSLWGFAWAGEGTGTHLPRRYVQIPEGYRTGGTSVHMDAGPFSADLQTAFSERTGNLFNPGATTRGGSILQGLISTELWIDGPSAGVRGRAVTSGYTPPGELDPDSSLALWSLPSGWEGRDDEVEVFAGSVPLMVRFAGRFPEGGGVIDRFSIGSSRTTGPLGTVLNARLVIRRGIPVLSEGNLNSIGLSMDLDLGQTAPFAGGSRTSESWEDSISGEVLTGFAGAAREFQGGSALIRFELQDDGRAGTPSGPFTVWRGRLEGAASTGPWRFGGTAEHSSTSYDAGGELQADAIGLTVSGTVGDAWLQSVYSGSGALSRSLEVIYVWVGAGEGSYSFDPGTGQYYPDPHGDYEVSYQPGSAGGNITSASLETSISVAGNQDGVSLSILISSSGEDDRTGTLLLFNAFDPEREGSYGIDVSPWWRWDDGFVRRVSAAGRYSDRRISYSGAGLRSEREWSVGVSPQLRPAEEIAVYTSALLWREEEDLYGPRDIRGFRMGLDPALILRPGSEVGILIAAERRTEVNASLQDWLYQGGPHFSWRSTGWTSSAEVTAGYIPGEGHLPSWFFDGDGYGLSWRTSARVGRAVSAGLDLNLFYLGRRSAGDEWIHRAGLEGTVSF